MATIDPGHLNRLFVLLHRSLLQYLGECSPWTAEDSHQSDTLAALRDIVTRQEQDETLLANEPAPSTPVDTRAAPRKGRPV